MINQNQLILTPVLSSDFSKLKQQETLNALLYVKKAATKLVAIFYLLFQTSFLFLL